MIFIISLRVIVFSPGGDEQLEIEKFGKGVTYHRNNTLNKKETRTVILPWSALGLEEQAVKPREALYVDEPPPNRGKIWQR
jgi:hypothetical protein